MAMDFEKERAIRLLGSTVSGLAATRPG
jgi:hypothetical protein